MDNHLTSSNGVDPDTYEKRDVAGRGEKDSERYIIIGLRLHTAQFRLTAA